MHPHPGVVGNLAFERQMLNSSFHSRLFLNPRCQSALVGVRIHRNHPITTQERHQAQQRRSHRRLPDPALSTNDSKPVHLGQRCIHRRLLKILSLLLSAGLEFDQPEGQLANPGPPPLLQRLRGRLKQQPIIGQGVRGNRDRACRAFGVGDGIRGYPPRVLLNRSLPPLT
ncbi:Uncharacterised protein [Mycobacteroides abscessus subsp. abscessus]|nr:Uncharacterised protein [Mycobacteroides abscessus subsp. abscessus]